MGERATLLLSYGRGRATIMYEAARRHGVQGVPAMHPSYRYNCYKFWALAGLVVACTGLIPSVAHAQGAMGGNGGGNSFGGGSGFSGGSGSGSGSTGFRS